MNRHKCMAVYTQKLQLVCDYIQRHLDEDLDVDRLSQIATLSKFHFHRIFAIHVGLNVMKFIQLSRLKRYLFNWLLNPISKLLRLPCKQGLTVPRHLLVHLSVHLIKLLGLLEINQTGNLGTRSLFYDSKK